MFLEDVVFTRSALLEGEVSVKGPWEDFQPLAFPRETER